MTVLAETLIHCDRCHQPIHGDLTGSPAGLTHPWCADGHPRPDDETTCLGCGETLVFGAENWLGFWPDCVFCCDCEHDDSGRPAPELCEHGNSRSVCPYTHSETS